MHTKADLTTRSGSNELAAIDNCAESRQWQADFAGIYAAREPCTSAQAARAASILYESLCLLLPLDAVEVVLADGDLFTAVRIATRDVPEGSPEGSQPSCPTPMEPSALAHRA